MIRGFMSPENADRAAFGIGHGMQPGVHAARPRENSPPDCFWPSDCDRSDGPFDRRVPLFRPQAGRRAVHLQGGCIDHHRLRNGQKARQPRNWLHSASRHLLIVRAADWSAGNVSRDRVSKNG